MPALEAQIAKPVIATPADGLAEAYLAVAGSLDQPAQVLLRTTFLRFALALRPDLSAARLLLANAQSGGDQPPSVPIQPAQMQQALATLQPIPATDPLYGPAALQEANLLAALGQPDQAVGIAGQIDRRLAGKHRRLAGSRRYPARRRAVSAIHLLLRPRHRRLPKPVPPAAWALYYDRGISQDQGGNWQAAEPDLQTALALSPNQPYVLNYLGYTWALRGQNMKQAHDMLQQAVGLDPNEGAIIDSLGYVNLRQGDTSSALKLLTQAVELDPDDAEVNAHLGDAFWAAGMRLQAGYQWQRALGLQPDAKLQAEIEGKLKQMQPPA